MLARYVRFLRYTGVPLGTVGRVPIKLHLSFPVLFLVAAVVSGNPLWSAVLCVMLFVLSLLHECSHLAAAKVFGGYYEEVVLWPLGGLAEPETPLRPWTQCALAAAGPLLHAGILLLFLPWALKQYPVRLWPLAEDNYLTLFLCLNQIVLLANLLPAFLTDGGRLWQSLLWRIVGFSKATATTLMAALVLGLGGCVLAVTGHSVLFAVAGSLLLLSVVYYESTLRIAEIVDDQWVETPLLYAGSYHRRLLIARIRHWYGKRKQERKHLRRVREAQLLDSLLRKINSRGLASLTARERRFLQRKSSQLKRRRQIHSN